MKSIEINISIPLSEHKDPSPEDILKLVAETLEERFSEIDAVGNADEETVADRHGFGGNTITLSCGGLVEEVCL